LPPDYIERRVFNETEPEKEMQLIDIVVPSCNSDLDWDQWNGEVLILLVDGPGMGKSSALTRLEQELREKLDKSPRVIVRINLNTVCQGIEESVEKGVQKVIGELFAPLKNFSVGKVEVDSPVYILLDGLDEVLTQNQESVISVIQFLLSKNSLKKGWTVEKVVLTTRPHLKELIKLKFNVPAYSLVPLTEKEQMEFIKKRTGRRDPWKLPFPWRTLSFSMRELVSNPLMLSMYCSVIADEELNSFDEYEMYMKFMVKKHELYASEKKEVLFVSRMVLKQMLSSIIPFYNYVAIREILGEYKLKMISDLPQSAQIVEPDPVKMTELLSFGVVVKIGEELKFAHRSFAKFFYAKLMTDIEKTPKEVRNALFALGYDVRNNVANFVSFVVGKDPNSVQFVSNGWTEFVPDWEELGTYVEYDGILRDHIMSVVTDDYEGNCPGRVELLVRSLQKHDRVFVQWLCDKRHESRVRNFLLRENNTRILATLLFSFGYAEIIFWDATSLSKQSYHDTLFGRVTWMLQKERQVISEDILRCSRDNCGDLDRRWYTLLASAFSKDKLYHLIVNEETRVSDLIGHNGLLSVSTCLGEEFLPNRLLKFRFKVGVKKGKSLFQYKFPEDFMNRVWVEIGEELQDAVQVAHDDKDFEFIRQMEDNLRNFKGECKSNRMRSKPLLI